MTHSKNEKPKCDGYMLGSTLVFFLPKPELEGLFLEFGPAGALGRDPFRLQVQG